MQASWRNFPDKNDKSWKNTQQHVNFENHKFYGFFNFNSIIAVTVRWKIFCTSKDICLDVSKIPYFGYCSIVWAILAEVSDKPQQLNSHNRSTRITTFSYYKVRSRFLKDFGLERLERRRIKQLAEVMCENYYYCTWIDRVSVICHVFVYLILEILFRIGPFLTKSWCYRRKPAS